MKRDSAGNILSSVQQREKRSAPAVDTDRRCWEVIRGSGSEEVKSHGEGQGAVRRAGQELRLKEGHARNARSLQVFKSLVYGRDWRLVRQAPV